MWCFDVGERGTTRDDLQRPGNRIQERSDEVLWFDPEVFLGEFAVDKRRGKDTPDTRTAGEDAPGEEDEGSGGVEQAHPDGLPQCQQFGLRFYWHQS